MPISFSSFAPSATPAVTSAGPSAPGAPTAAAPAARADGIQTDFQAVLTGESAAAPKAPATVPGAPDGTAAETTTPACGSSAAKALCNTAMPLVARPVAAVLAAAASVVPATTGAKAAATPAPKSQSRRVQTAVSEANAAPADASGSATPVVQVPATGAVAAATPENISALAGKAKQAPGSQDGSAGEVPVAPAGTDRATTPIPSQPAPEAAIPAAAVPSPKEATTYRMPSTAAVGAKIAAPASAPLAENPPARTGVIKNSGVINQQTDTNAMIGVGTSVANSSSAMTPSSSIPLPSASLFGAVVSVTSEQSAHAPQAQASPQVAASQAIENALQVTDLQSAKAQGSQSAVALNFNVGGESLSVRVAVQEGQVHTQFKTDSTDLRSAIAHEWQAVGPESASGVRFADPVFNSASGAEARAGTDLGQGSRQQGQPAYESAEGSLPSPRAADTADRASVAPSSGESEPVSANLSGRLNSFA